MKWIARSADSNFLYANANYNLIDKLEEEK